MSWENTIRSNRIGVAALSDGIQVYKRDMRLSMKIAKRMGLQPHLAPNIWAQTDDFDAGDPASRLEQFRWLTRKKFPVAWMAEGGYSMTDIALPAKISNELISLYRDWDGLVIGYSDSCCLAVAALYLDKYFVMGPNFAGLHQWDKYTFDYLHDLLINRILRPIEEDRNWQPGVIGEATAPLFASNLDVMVGFFGTNLDPIKNAKSEKGMILAIEELGVTQVDVERKLLQVLCHSDALKKIKGLIVGRLLTEKYDYPKYSHNNPMEDIIVKLVKENLPNIPVAFLWDFGHPEWGEGLLWKVKRLFAQSKAFIPLVNGVMATLIVKKDSCRLEYKESIWPIK